MDKYEVCYQARQVAPSSSPSRLPQLRPSRLHCPEWGTRVKIFKVNLNMLVIRFVIITLKSNFRGSLKESQFGWGTQNSYLSWEIKTLRSIPCQDLQFLDLKNKIEFKIKWKPWEASLAKICHFSSHLASSPAPSRTCHNFKTISSWFNSEKAISFIISSKTKQKKKNYLFILF